MRARLHFLVCCYGYAIGLALYGAVLILLHLAHRFPSPGARDPAHLIGTPVVTLEGRIVDFPTTRWNQTRFLLKGKAWTSLNDKIFQGRTLVTLTFPETNLAPGEWVRVHGWLSAPRPPSRTRAFDEEEYWSGQGVYSMLRVWSPMRLERLASPPWWHVRFQAWRFRRCFEAFWQDRLPWDEAGLLLGMTLGARGTLPASLKEACMRAGVYHIVVVSGQAVSLVISVGLVFLRALRIPARRAFWICAVPVVFYACVVGAEPPVVRASAMALIGLSVLVLGRDTLRFQPLLLAAGGVLLVSPEALFSASFQLSFGATASLLVMAQFVRRPRVVHQSLGGRVADWFMEMGCLCLAVTIGVGPILVYYFHRFSLIGLVANWTVFPFAGITMISGLILGICGLLYPPLVRPTLVKALTLLLHTLIGLIRSLSSGRWSAINLPPPSGRILVVYYGMLFGILWAFHRRRTDALTPPFPTRRHRL